MFQPEDETYNGYTNKSTWAASAWASSTERAYRHIMANEPSPDALAQWVHDTGLVEESFYVHGDVNWTEVWKALFPDDTTALHGAGDCDFDTCSECQEDARCPECGEGPAPLVTSRLTGEATRQCECGCTFI